MKKQSVHPSIYQGAALCATGALFEGYLLLRPEGINLLVAATGGTAGAFFLAVGGYQILIGRLVPLLSMASRALSQGDPAELRESIEKMEALPGRWLTRGSSEMLRSALTFMQGDLAGAATHGRASRAGARGFFTQFFNSLVSLQGSSYLALALALQKDPAALAEARSAEQNPLSFPDVVARSLLARAVLLDGQGQREELRVLLRTEAACLLEASLPRERALVRALRRKVRGEPAAGYRQAAPGERGVEEDAPEIEAWLRQVAPQVLGEPVSEAGEPLAEADPMPFEDEPMEQARRQHKASKPVEPLPASPAPPSFFQRTKAPLLLTMGTTLVIAVVVVIQQAMGGPAQSASLAEADPGSRVLLFPVLFVLLFVVFYARFIREIKARLALLAEAQRLIWRGRPSEAIPVLVRSRTGKTMAYFAYADLLTATALEHLGRPDEALERCDAGISLARKQAARVTTHDTILPGLLTERAFLLAALDREKEALTTLAKLEKEFPEHWQRAQARLRVELIISLRQGKLAEAATIAARRPSSMSIGLREELVCDALGLLSRSSPAAIVRLREEITDSPGVEAWMDRYVPAVLRALGRAGRASA